MTHRYNNTALKLAILSLVAVTLLGLALPVEAVVRDPRAGELPAVDSSYRIVYDYQTRRWIILAAGFFLTFLLFCPS